MIEGDPGVSPDFEEFFKNEYQPLLFYATYYALNEADADDAVDRVMFDLCMRWRSVTHPKTWARRRIIWTLQRTRTAKGSNKLVTMPGESLPDRVCSANECDDFVVDQWIELVLGYLPATQRHIMRLYLEGWSPREIAAEFRKSEATVRKNYQLARQKLRWLFEQDQLWEDGGPSSGRRKTGERQQIRP